MDIQFESPRKGWTVVADFDESTGEYLEPQVGNGHDPTSPFADSQQELPTDYLAPESLEPSESEGEDMIVEGIHELYPDLDNILDFAIEAYGDEITQLYDQAIEDSDWSSVHKYLEQWSEEYREGQTPQVNYEEVTQELNTLAESESLGTETAFEFLQMAEQASDPIESEMLQLTASFHKGDVSAEDAIQSMLDRYPIDQLLPIYNKLNK